MKYLKENGMYAIVAEPNMVIKFDEDYCHKLYRKTNDFSDCTEVDASVVPVAEAEALQKQWEEEIE